MASVKQITKRKRDHCSTISRVTRRKTDTTKDLSIEKEAYTEENAMRIIHLLRKGRNQYGYSVMVEVEDKQKQQLQINGQTIAREKQTPTAMPVCPIERMDTGEQEDHVDRLISMITHLNAIYCPQARTQTNCSMVVLTLQDMTMKPTIRGLRFPSDQNQIGLTDTAITSTMMPSNVLPEGTSYDLRNKFDINEGRNRLTQQLPRKKELHYYEHNNCKQIYKSRSKHQTDMRRSLANQGLCAELNAFIVEKNIDVNNDVVGVNRNGNADPELHPINEGEKAERVREHFINSRHNIINLRMRSTSTSMSYDLRIKSQCDTIVRPGETKTIWVGRLAVALEQPYVVGYRPIIFSRSDLYYCNGLYVRNSKVLGSGDVLLDLHNLGGKTVHMHPEQQVAKLVFAITGRQSWMLLRNFEHIPVLEKTNAVTSINTDIKQGDILEDGYAAVCFIEFSSPQANGMSGERGMVMNDDTFHCFDSLVDDDIGANLCGKFYLCHGLVEEGTVPRPIRGKLVAITFPYGIVNSKGEIVVG